MTSRLLVSCLRRAQSVPCRYVTNIQDVEIGNREIVGNGHQGVSNYFDTTEFPFPAIRFKECTPDILALKEKEKGDWKKLSIEEKKALYRASFCQTFAEINAPTGEWKHCLGLALMGISLACWLYYFMHFFVYPERPKSFSKESRLAQLERMKIMNVNPIWGLCRPDNP